MPTKCLPRIKPFGLGNGTKPFAQTEYLDDIGLLSH